MSGTSAVTAMIYAGNAQSLNGLARDFLARGTLYQSCHSRCSCVGFFPLRSCRLAATAFLSSKYSGVSLTQTRGDCANLFLLKGICVKQSQ